MDPHLVLKVAALLIGMCPSDRLRPLVGRVYDVLIAPILCLHVPYSLNSAATYIYVGYDCLCLPCTLWVQ
jgi:hypothetical protein